MRKMVILEWIDVKKQLPEYGDYVLVTNGDFVTEAHWNGEGFYYVEGCMSEDRKMYDATHWMRKPLPPE